MFLHAWYFVGLIVVTVTILHNNSSAGDPIIPSWLSVAASDSFALVPLLQIAFAGFATQALVNRMQPIEALTTHIGNPGKNITYYLTHLPETLGPYQQ